MRLEDKDELIRGFVAINAMLREDLHALRCLIKTGGAEAKYNPNWSSQPRAPRGVADSGQWVNGGAAGKPTRRTSKETRPREQMLGRDPPRREGPPEFFDPVDDNPYFWILTERGFLPAHPTTAEFYNLRFDLMSMNTRGFAAVAQQHGMTSAELLHDLDRGSSVMAPRAIASIERIFRNPGFGGVNIVARDRALRRTIALAGVRQEYRDNVYHEILRLAGFTPDDYEQHQRDVGVGQQLAFMLGGGGPASTVARVPRAAVAANAARSVWSMGWATRGRVVEAALGHNLPSSFRVIDRFDDQTGIATSIKTVDLGALTYQRPQTLERHLRGLIDQVAGFRGATFGRFTIVERNISQRTLDLVVPYAGSTAQREVIERAIDYAASRGVSVIVIIYP